MKLIFTSIALFFFVCTSFSQAVIAGDDSQPHEQIRLCSATVASMTKSKQAQQALRLLLELGSIYRESGHEARARAWLIQKAESAGYEYKVERVRGNLIIYVPGTKRFQGLNQRIALQTHLDMVIDLKDPSIDKKAYFESGIPFVLAGRDLHTEDHQSTAGFDNGAGLVTMTRYLVDPTLEHPPLELIYTTREEVGLRGAREMKLPILSKVLLNLDGMEDGEIVHHSMAGSRIDISTTAEGFSRIPAYTPRYRITMEGLIGGHSAEIRVGQANGLRMMFELMLLILDKDPEAYFPSASVGELKVNNKVPSKFELEVASKSMKAWPQAYIVAEFRDRIRDYPKENIRDVKVEMTAIDGKPEQKVISTEYLRKVINQLRTLPDGLVTIGRHEEPHPELNSLNLAYWVHGGAETQLQLGLMPRSFDNRELESLIEEVKSRIYTFAKQEEVGIVRTPSWQTPKDSWLITKFMETVGTRENFRIGKILGGIEPTMFAQRYPDLQMFSFGPEIRKAHSRFETMDLDSFEKFIRVLDEFLIALGEEWTDPQ